MAVYAFSLIKQFRDFDGNLKTIYGRYINDKLWCVWYYGTGNDKIADEDLKVKGART